MNRAKLGSVLFISAILVSLVAPRENQALADRGRVHPRPRAIVNAKQDPPPAVLVSAEIEAVVAPEIGATGSCPDGMLEVEGDFCPDVEQRCLRYIDPEGVFPRRCAEFAPTSTCNGKTAKKHFCIDRYEWPNKVGENPVVMKTWYDAKSACAGAGKRLCGDSEWTLACEGQERLPYPYGYERSSEACNIDKPHPDVNERALGSADPKVRDAEARRLWQGEPSGSRSSCVSPYGVSDMTGNVDEWVVNESGQPYKSGLKGGYWGPVRDRCRPMTTVHSEGFSFYQIGFRCCSDVSTAAPSNEPAPIGPATTTPAMPSTSPLPGVVIGS